MGANDAKNGSVPSGAAYLFFGGPSGLGTTPTVLVGPPNSAFGYSVSAAGDVDGDGYGDFLVGAPAEGPLNAGAAYLYRGHPGTTFIQYSAALSGTGTGLSEFGINVAGVGDLDGDGYSDIAVGESYFSYWSGASPAGKVFVWYGGPSGISGPGIELISPDSALSDGFGYSISEAADVNGDGYHDLVVGSGGANGDDGAVYVWYGGIGGIDPSAPDLAIYPPTLQDGFFGFAVSAAGDLDEDGIDDLIIGECDANSFAGQVHALPSTTGALTQLTNPGAQGYFGQNVNIVGNVNGDRLADFLVGATGNDGAAYLFPSTGTAPVPSDALPLTPTGDRGGWIGL